MNTPQFALMTLAYLHSSLLPFDRLSLSGPKETGQRATSGAADPLGSLSIRTACVSAQLFSPHPCPKPLQLPDFLFPQNPVISAPFSLLSSSLGLHCSSVYLPLSPPPPSLMAKSILLTPFNLLLPLLWTLPDAAGCSLPQIYSKNSPSPYLSEVFSLCTK